MFSIRTLLLVVAIIAVGVVGLTTRNVWWASMFATLTWVSVAAAIVAAIVWRGRSQLFATGFAVGAGLYLVMIFITIFEPFAGTLVSSRVVSLGWKALSVQRPQQPVGGAGSFTVSIDEDVESRAIPFIVGGNTEEIRAYHRELRSFFIVGHCLWAFFFGFLGALLAGYLARERLRGESPARSNPPA